MNKYRFEYVYDPRTDETNIYIWNGQTIVDHRILPGQLTKYTKNKIRKEIINELIEEE